MQKRTSARATIHFAHANGFPAASYNTVFAGLSSNLRVIAKDKFAHSDECGPGANWFAQAEELIEYVKAHANTDEGVFVAGHSFGAVISYMAACLHPSLFRGLIMLDPPLVTGVRRHLFQLLKYTPWINSVTPAGKTMKRKTRWEKPWDIENYFAQKELFKDMDPRCIRDYVAAATDDKGDYRELTFKAEIEAQLFRQVPHNLHRFSGKLQCPALLVTGSHSRVCVPSMRNHFLRNNAIPHKQIKGGHMFPLEHPDTVAELINSTVSQWLDKSN